MTSLRTVRRYASALYAAAERVGAVDRVLEDLELVRRTFSENPALRKAYLQSLTPDRQKKNVIRRIFSERIHELTVQFLEVLVDRRREDIVDGIEAAFRKVADERRGVERVDITSAVPLSDDQVRQAVGALERLTGKRVEVTNTVDAQILGGLLIRIGDRLLDASVRGEMERLGKALAGAA